MNGSSEVLSWPRKGGDGGGQVETRKVGGDWGGGGEGTPRRPLPHKRDPSDHHTIMPIRSFIHSTNVYEPLTAIKK